MEKKKSRIERQLDRELTVLSDSREMLKGSLTKVSLGKRKRTEGERTAWLLTWKDAGGKTKTLYASEAELPGVRTMLANYKKARKALDNITRIGVEIVKNRKQSD
jgi:hypothetical protein